MKINAEIYMKFIKGSEYSLPCIITYETEAHLKTILAEMSDSIFGIWANFKAHRGFGLIPLEDMYINEITDDGEYIPLISMSEVNNNGYHICMCTQYELSNIAVDLEDSFLTIYKKISPPNFCVLKSHYNFLESKKINVDYRDTDFMNITFDKDCIISIPNYPSTIDALWKFLGQQNYTIDGEVLQ